MGGAGRCAAAMAVAVCALVAAMGSVLAAECVPSCRSGYMCIDGQCVEKCNPPCNEDEFCNKAGECMPKDKLTPVRHNEMGPSSWYLGLSLGVIFPHDETIYSGEADAYYSNETGVALNITADFVLARYFVLGGYLLYINTATTVADDDVHMLSFGFHMKFPVYIGNRFQVRPGIGFGPAFVMSDLMDDDAIGVNPFFFLQFVFAVTDNIYLNLEYSFISMPWSEDDRVTFPPLSMLRLGVEFGQ